MSTELDTAARLQRQAEKVLDQLERVQNRTVQLYSRSREHERKSIRLSIWIFIPTDEQPTPPEGAKATPAWSYDVSQGGVGFVACDPIPGEIVYVGLMLGPKLTWRKGRVVRTKEVPETEFIDYGVTFRAGQ